MWCPSLTPQSASVSCPTARRFLALWPLNVVATSHSPTSLSLHAHSKALNTSELPLSLSERHRPLVWLRPSIRKVKTSQCSGRQGDGVGQVNKSHCHSLKAILCQAPHQVLHKHTLVQSAQRSPRKVELLPLSARRKEVP